MYGPVSTPMKLDRKSWVEGSILFLEAPFGFPEAEVDWKYPSISPRFSAGRRGQETEGERWVQHARDSSSGSSSGSRSSSSSSSSKYKFLLKFRPLRLAAHRDVNVLHIYYKYYGGP